MSQYLICCQVIFESCFITTKTIHFAFDSTQFHCCFYVLCIKYLAVNVNFQDDLSMTFMSTYSRNSHVTKPLSNPPPLPLIVIFLLLFVLAYNSISKCLPSRYVHYTSSWKYLPSCHLYYLPVQMYQPTHRYFVSFSSIVIHWMKLSDNHTESSQAFSTDISPHELYQFY